MTTIPLYGGPLKRDLVQLAYEECGQAGYEFELTPEEYDSALRRLDAMMGTWLSWGIDLGYNFPDYGNGSPEDESGVPREMVEAVASSLARKVAPAIGKDLGKDAIAALFMSLNAARSSYATIPEMQWGRGTPTGQGNRYVNGPKPFLPITTNTPVVE